MSNLTKAIQLAAEAHSAQRDKAGEPFILHPLRVMLSLSGEMDQVVGVLHDVVEKTDRNFADLARAGFSPDVTEAVRALTRNEGEDYTALVQRAKANPIARRVKIADIQDHLKKASIHQRPRYEAALVRLQSADD